MKLTTPFIKEALKMEKTILTVLFVAMFIASSMLVLSVHSTPDMTTTAYLDFAPDPIGVGQTLVIFGLIDPEPPTYYYYENLTLTITHPDSTVEVLGPFISDDQGAIWINYTPSKIGTYSVQFSCPEQTLDGVKYLSSSVVESFTVGPPNYVPAGENVEVFPDPEVGLVFDLVIVGGFVQVDKSMIGPPPDVGSLIGPYYYITTTAIFDPDLTVKIFYDDTGLTPQQEQALRMIQTDIVRGDVNLDGRVNWRDLMAIFRALRSYPGHWRWNPNCDLNKDNKINWIDLCMALKNYGKRSLWTDITFGPVDIDKNIITGITTHLDVLDPFGVR